ncbi:hypothetical protein FB459_1886 [Yimella lutea]|uniref:Uncharacterized protein n=1 Tax=Yimella lutea TaxID=587872 RepID=A0A542EGR2_9MICO|nr:hypothetical protein [Yimella lutea]TQJ14426.1 hypothetical protein FB459_1886 [Yimella lutea]
MGELGRPTATGRGLGAATNLGSSRDTSEATFTTTALVFDDMPQDFAVARTASSSTALVLRGGASPDRSTALVRAGDVVPSGSVPVPSKREIIADGVHQYTKPRRRGSDVVQRRVGWLATPSLIQVITVERPLRQDGKAYRPAGDWELARRVTYDCASGTAQRRKGVVTSDAVRSSASEPSGASNGSPVDEAAELAESALQFVPASVRRTVVSSVPAPLFTSGNIYRYKNGKHTVEVVRMDAARAVVLNAVLDAGASQWSVEQATYDLGPTRVEGLDG